MSKPSCDACSNLREYNANFIMNGVTDDIAASLASNTGLNPCLTDLHTDCEDLNDVNDCLIGHMDDDVDNYEVCDWKSLAHNFFPNLYETLKAMIASICGLWTKTQSIEDNLCALITGEWHYVYGDETPYNTTEYWEDGQLSEPVLAWRSLGSCNGSSNIYEVRMAYWNSRKNTGSVSQKMVKIIPTGSSNPTAIFRKSKVSGISMPEELFNAIQPNFLYQGTVGILGSGPKCSLIQGFLRGGFAGDGDPYFEIYTYGYCGNAVSADGDLVAEGWMSSHWSTSVYVIA